MNFEEAMGAGFPDYKKARKKKGYTQSQVARLIGVSLTAYQLIEHGVTQKPRKKTLIKLQEVLDETGSNQDCSN